MTIKGLKNGLVALLAASVAVGVKADCECGYSTNVGNSKKATVFTELLETDFSRADDLTNNGEWILPSFNVTKEQTHGSFGLTFRPGNVMALASKGPASARSETGKSDKTEKTDNTPPPVKDAALQLHVSSHLDEDMVSVAEIDSRGADLRYGSYRASLQLTDVPGTCAAFMWYLNDTQEIDMEFLSKDFNFKNGTYPVNLIVQSPKAHEEDYDAKKAGNFVRTDLPFNPTKGFHEYRFDFVYGEVHFYADGQQLAKIRGATVPEDSGHLVLQHWSNGNDVWSGGPPEKDTSILVRYVKAYYNSTDHNRQSEWNKRCTGTNSPAKAICPIPEIGANKSAENHFFSKKKNETKIRNITDNKASDATPRPADNEDEGSAAMWGVQMGVVVGWGAIAGIAALAL